MHNIGKVSVIASILYKNQEICNKTNLWKFQLILLFLLRENSKNAFSIFVFILMVGVVVSRLARRKLIVGSYFTNYSKTITHQAEIFKGKLSAIVIFIPCKLCVNLWTFCFSVLPMLSRGFKMFSLEISNQYISRYTLNAHLFSSTGVHVDFCEVPG